LPIVEAIVDDHYNAACGAPLDEEGSGDYYYYRRDDHYYYRENMRRAAEVAAVAAYAMERGCPCCFTEQLFVDIIFK
jgi:hypothetical protein